MLSPAREQSLNAAYRRHALKSVVTARHVVGLRAAAFLAPGSARVRRLGQRPVGVRVGYFFTDQIKAVMADVHSIERCLGLAGLLALAAVLVVGMWRWHSRVGKERLDQERAERHSPTS